MSGRRGVNSTVLRAATDRQTAGHHGRQNATSLVRRNWSVSSRVRGTRTERTGTKLTQLHDASLVTRVSVTKLIGWRAAACSAVQIITSAVNTALVLVSSARLKEIGILIEINGALYSNAYRYL